MILFFILLSFGVIVGADKLDRTYLPPPGSKFAGGSPDSILPPIELPREPNFSATTLRPQTPDVLNSTLPDFFETRHPGLDTVSPEISRYNPNVPFRQKNGFGNEGQSSASIIPQPINNFDGTKRTGYISTHAAGTSVEPAQFHKGYTVPTTTTSYAFTQTTTFSPIQEDECFGTTCAYNQDGFVDTGVEPDFSISHQSPDQFTNVPESDIKIDTLIKQQPTTISKSSAGSFPTETISGDFLQHTGPFNIHGKPIVSFHGQSAFPTQPPNSELTQEGYDEKGRPIYKSPGQTIISDSSYDTRGRLIKTGTDFPISTTRDQELKTKNQLHGFAQQGRPIYTGFNKSTQNNIQRPIQNANQGGSLINDHNIITQDVNTLTTDKQGRPIVNTPSQGIYNTEGPVQQVDGYGRPIAKGPVFSGSNSQNYGVNAQRPITKVDQQGNHIISDTPNISSKTSISQSRQGFDYVNKGEIIEPGYKTPGQQFYGGSQGPIQQLNELGRPIVPNTPFLGSDNQNLSGIKQTQIQNFNQQGRPIATYNQAGAQESLVTNSGPYSNIYQHKDELNINNFPKTGSTSLPQSVTSSQVTLSPVDQDNSPLLSSIPQLQTDFNTFNELQKTFPETVAQSSTFSSSTPYAITSLSSTDSNIFGQGSSVLPTYENGFSNNRQNVLSLRPQDNYDRNSEILNYKNIIKPNGEFEYSYDTSNGIHADENGTAIDGVKAQGAYSYIGDDGKNYSIVYTADENGFLPKGDHLPTSPPIPEAIVRLIEKANEEEAAGITDDGLYNEEKYGYKNYQTMMDHMPHGLYTFHEHTKTDNIKPDEKEQDFNKSIDNIQERPTIGRRPSSKGQNTNNQTPTYNRQGQYSTNVSLKDKEEPSAISSLEDMGKDYDQKQDSHTYTPKHENTNIERKQKPVTSSSRKQQNGLLTQENQKIPTRRLNNTLIKSKKPTNDHDYVNSDTNEDLISNNYKNILPSDRQRVLSKNKPKEERFENVNKSKNIKQDKAQLKSNDNVKDNIPQNKERFPSIKTPNYQGIPSSQNASQQQKHFSENPIDRISKTNNQETYELIKRKPIKGLQYLPSLSHDNVSDKLQEYDKEELIRDSKKDSEEEKIQHQQPKGTSIVNTQRPSDYKSVLIYDTNKQRRPDILKSDTKSNTDYRIPSTKGDDDENLEEDNDDYIDRNKQRRPNILNPYRKSNTEYRKPISKGLNDENLEQDNVDFIDSTNNLKDDTTNLESRQPSRYLTTKPLVSVRPNSSNLRPVYDNSVQASTRRPSLLIQNNYEKYNGYQYIPPKDTFETNDNLPAHSVVGSSHNILRPLNVDSNTIKSIHQERTHFFHPEINRENINTLGNQENYEPNTRRLTYSQSQDRKNQQITGSTLRPDTEYDEFSRTSTNHPTFSTPNYESTPNSIYSPQLQSVSNNNQGYPQKQIGNSVTGTEQVASSIPFDQTLTNIGITGLPYRPVHSNSFTSTTSRPYYPKTSGIGTSGDLPPATIFSERRPTSEMYYPNVPSSYPLQTLDPINIQEHSTTPKYDYSQRELNRRPISPQTPGRQLSVESFSNTASTYPSLTSGNNQDSTTAIPDYSLIDSPISGPAYPGRRPTTSAKYPSQTLRPSNIPYGTTLGPDFKPGLIKSSQRPLAQGSDLNKSYIPSFIPSTLAPGFKRIGENERPETDAYGRPISNQDRVRGEDFSGPKQLPRFDPETGYHY